MNIKFDYCKCIRIYEKAHLRSDFRKKIFPWLGLEPTKGLLWWRVKIKMHVSYNECILYGIWKCMLIWQGRVRESEQWTYTANFFTGLMDLFTFFSSIDNVFKIEMLIQFLLTKGKSSPKIQPKFILENFNTISLLVWKNYTAHILCSAYSVHYALYSTNLTNTSGIPTSNHIRGPWHFSSATTLLMDHP